MLLENLSWPEVKKLKLAKKVVLFPLGSFEQHGPHLPLTTDTDIVTAIARRLEQKRPDKILCLPTLGLGHACEMETSIMLYLHPNRVKQRLAKRDGPKYTDPYRKADMQYARPIYYVNEFHEISKTGTVGHPDLATAEKGKKFLNGIVK